MKKVLLEITELSQGGFKVRRLDPDFLDDRLDPTFGPVPVIGDEIFAEKLTLSKTGLSGRLHNRLIEIFEKEA